MIRYTLAVSCIALALSANAGATTVDEELKALKARIEQLEAEKEQAPEKEGMDKSIKFGGAARFQSSYDDYSDANTDRGGDFDFDLFRIDVNGNLDDVIFSAQYRWFEYMNVIHHAWVGYNFDDEQQGNAEHVAWGVEVPLHPRGHRAQGGLRVGAQLVDDVFACFIGLRYGKESDRDCQNGNQKRNAGARAHS